MGRLACTAELLENMVDDMCDRVARRNYELEIIASQVWTLGFRLSMCRLRLFNWETVFSFKRLSKRQAAIRHLRSNRSALWCRRARWRCNRSRLPKYHKVRHRLVYPTAWHLEKCHTPTIFYSTDHTCNDCVCNHPLKIIKYWWLILSAKIAQSSTIWFIQPIAPALSRRHCQRRHLWHPELRQKHTTQLSFWHSFSSTGYQGHSRKMHQRGLVS